MPPRSLEMTLPRPSSDYSVRISYHGDYAKLGYLEVSYDNTWYSVHPDTLDRPAATTACRQLGFDHVCRMKVTDEGRDNPLTNLNQYVQCMGTEPALSFCVWTPTVTLLSTQYALLQCVNATDVELRLFGGIVSSEGILQIRCDPNDEWKGFCGGAQWDARDCHVVCLQLGHKICSRWGYDESTSGNVSSDVISANLYCGFNELQLLDCDMSWEDQCDVEAYGLAWMSCSIDIEILGSESYLCGSDHTCVNQCGKWKRNEGCNCDEACVQFHDCCFDYDDVCTSEDDFEIQELTHSKYSDPNLLPSYECIKTGLITENDAYVLISKCPPGFNQPGTVQYCEHDSTHLEDMFLRTPVYDENGLVFSNVYCAICHGRKVTDVQGWTISVISTPGEPLLYDTVFEVRLPIGRLYKPSANTELGKARLCVSTWNRSTSCQRPPSDASITQSSAKCDLYFAPISTLIDGENKRFRNADCLLCSGLLGGKGLPPPEGAGPCVSYTNYRCHADGHLPCGRLVHTRSRSTLASTPLNFSFSELDRYGQRAGKLCSNEDGESYDPFVKNCRVLQCPRYFLHYGNRCLPSSVPDDFKIKTRLAGNESNRGFVQVQHTNGKWYTAVDTLFNDTESMVLCRELGLDFEPIIHVIKGKDDRELYTLKLECHGNETSMNDCHLSFNQKLAADVITGNRVYVRCLNTSSYSIRLYGGILASEGFVQIRYESEWFFINGDTLHWDYRDGTVVCWELNLRYCASTDKRQLRSFNDSSSVIRRQVVCNGKHRNETFKSCLGQPEYLTSVNRLAWVTCAITSDLYNNDTYICGSDHTCRNRCGGWYGTCNCDSVCLFFGDCCDDYKDLCQPAKEDSSRFRTFPTKIALKQYSCIESDFLSRDIYAISDCADGWIQVEISMLCKLVGPQSALGHLPVYDDHGVIYRNRYCAICNRVPLENFTSFLYSITAQAVIPDTGIGVPRTCFGNLWQGEGDCESEVANKCFRHYFPVMGRYVNSITYQSVYCARCHVTDSYSVPYEYCSLDKCPESLPHHTCAFGGWRNTLSLLSFDNFIGFDSGTSNCSHPWQIFDPVVKTCRFSGCPYGYFYHKGSCKEGIAPHNAPQIILAKESHECYQCMKSFLSRQTMEPLKIVVCSLLSDVSTTGPFSVKITSKNIFDWLIVFYAFDGVLGTNDAKETIYHQCGVTIINLSLEEDVLLQTTHCNYEKDIVESTAELCQMTTDINVATYEYQPTVEYFSSTFTNDSDFCWRDLMANLTCSLSHSEPWSSNADELKLTFDSKLLIPDYLFSSIQRPTDLNPNYTIWICSYNDNNLISEIIETFTDICYAISVGVTFLALLTFFKFSQQLGNVAERCRMNLIMTLSMAYVFHFLNRVLGEHDVICQLIAMCSHYIWNVFWLWICIPFYKMVYKYKQQLTQSPFTFRETGKTMRYMFLAWGLPLALTLICVFLSQCHCTPTAYEIQYMGDGDHCFVAGYLAVLVTVIFPAGMVMLYAVFCLVYSFRALLKHKPLQTNCQKATGAHAELLSEIRDNFVLYIALCITCGVGFMNHIWPSSLLGIVFSLLRAVHGTLVAVIFMVRRNAKALWFDALLTEKLTKE
ncbi:uncharacterized protein [Apostichopus japonicus]|uniref:uncharacterized protein isoform X1 n=2 Tax=Stichopus japonicus TaxID=307972 RepID=UPI003AB883C4